MKRAAIYCRVSTEQQETGGTSLQSQAEACLRYAEANDFTVVEVFQESRSGGNLNRPMLDRVREMAQAGEIDAVIFYALDRLSRDTTDALILVREWQEKGVALECATVKLEDSAQGQFMMTILVAAAKLEKAGIAERMQRGRRQTLRGGRVSTNATPYGYAKNGNGGFAIVDDEAEVVRMVYRWVGEEHHTLLGACKRLTDMGIVGRNGGKWHKSTLLLMLRSETYKGTWHYGKYVYVQPKTDRRRGTGERKKDKTTAVLRPREEWIGVSVPAIIESKLWDRVQVALRENQDRNSRNRKHDYLLSSLIRCSVCGRRFQAFTERGVMFYQCISKNSTYRAAGYEACGNPRVKGVDLESKAWWKVIRFLANPSIVTDWANDGSAEWQAEQAKDEAQLRLLDRQAKEMESKESGLVDLFITGGTTREMYDQKNAELAQRRETIDREAQELRTRIQQRRDASVNRAGVRALARRYRRWLQEFGTNPPFEKKREMVEALQIEVIADPDPAETEIKGVFSGGYFTMHPDGNVTGIPGITKKVIEIASRTGLPTDDDAAAILRPQYIRPIDIGIEQADSRTSQRQGQGQVDGHGGLAHATLAAGNG